jgi:hypothetical protein
VTSFPDAWISVEMSFAASEERCARVRT